MKVSELKRQLDEQNIPYKSSDKKEDLLNLLSGDDKNE
ncbi:TPA: HeH/LEM domain-containing protein [Enterococcus faecium]